MKSEAELIIKLIGYLSEQPYEEVHNIIPQLHEVYMRIIDTGNPGFDAQLSRKIFSYLVKKPYIDVAHLIDQLICLTGKEVFENKGCGK